MTLHSFCGQANCADGSGPNSLTQGSDGNFYGTTQLGGSYQNSNCNYFDDGCGTVFQLTPSGTFTTIYIFCNTNGNTCPDGQRPIGGLVQGSDGNYYGSTDLGGSEANSNCSAYGCGTIFKVTPAGSLTTIYSFCSTTSCPDGSFPRGNLVQAADGDLYGFTSSEDVVGGCQTTGGPQSDCATFFKVTSSGALTTLYDFCSDQTNSCPNGSDPIQFPLLGADGNFYSTTRAGGPINDGSGLAGTMFQLTPAGVLTTLYDFCSLGNGNGSCPDGSSPEALTQGSDGNFYGTTQSGGPADGIAYRAVVSPAVGAPVGLSLSALNVATGTPVTLSWQVFNAFSQTIQQCYAFVQDNAIGAGTWTGLQAGTLQHNIYQGSTTVTPTAAGVYSYALTCGGLETGISGFLFVGGAKIPTSTQLAISPLEVTVGSLVTLTAVPSTQQTAAPFTGFVTFSYGNITLGTLPIENGSAILNVTAQGIPINQTYKIAATYTGDANYQPSSGSGYVYVEGLTTATTLTASTAQVTQGQAVTLLAAVARSSVSGTPSGSVTFSYGSSVLGTAKLVNGAASFTAATNGSIPPGTYGVTAKYDGDATDQTSVSAPVNVTVIAATATTLSVSPTTVPKNSAVMLTSVVARKYDAGVPTGSVTFRVGSYVLGTQALDGTGTAVVNASSVGIAAGTYPVTATYSGDAANAASSSTEDVTVE